MDNFSNQQGFDMNQNASFNSGSNASNFDNSNQYYGNQNFNQPNYNQGYAQPNYNQGYAQPNYGQPQGAYAYGNGAPMYQPLPVKSKMAAGLLYLLLGDIGVGNFYMGKIGLGILDIVFCWTGIPGLVGFIRGIIILCSSNESFAQKYNVIPEN